MTTLTIQGRLHDWWQDFARSNPESKVQWLSEELSSRSSSIDEFYWAYVYSRVDEIIYNLQFLDFLKLLYPRIFAEWVCNKEHEVANQILLDAGELFRNVITLEDSSKTPYFILRRKEPPVHTCGKKKGEDRFLYGDARANFESFEIIGKSDFIHQTISALTLIHARSADEYKVVRDYIGQIREWYQSGITVYSYPPIFYMSRKVAFSSITWCASAIAHEAWHSKLYNEHKRRSGDVVVPGEIYHGQKIEIECNEFQYKVLTNIGGPSNELEWLATMDGSHWNQGWEDESLRPY